MLCCESLTVKIKHLAEIRDRIKRADKVVTGIYLDSVNSHILTNEELNGLTLLRVRFNSLKENRKLEPHLNSRLRSK